MKNTFGRIAMLIAILFSVSCAISEPATTVALPIQIAKQNFDGTPQCPPPFTCVPGTR